MSNADGSITLPPNPWGSAATWDDYDWRKIAASERAARGVACLTAQVLDLIADAVEATTDDQRTTT